MNEILVSVVIPAYNCIQYIGQALDSALIQDVPMEIIVINDCSRDDLDGFMKPYLEKHPQIHYLKTRRIWVLRKLETVVFVMPGASISLSWMPMTIGWKAS